MESANNTASAPNKPSTSQLLSSRPVQAALQIPTAKPARDTVAAPHATTDVDAERVKEAARRAKRQSEIRITQRKKIKEQCVRTFEKMSDQERRILFREFNGNADSYIEFMNLLYKFSKTISDDANDDPVYKGYMEYQLEQSLSSPKAIAFKRHYYEAFRKVIEDCDGDEAREAEAYKSLSSYLSVDSMGSSKDVKKKLYFPAAKLQDLMLKIATQKQCNRSQS